jgi:hypothetical protein
MLFGTFIKDYLAYDDRNQSKYLKVDHTKTGIELPCRMFLLMFK